MAGRNRAKAEELLGKSSLKCSKKGVRSHTPNIIKIKKKIDSQTKAG